MKLNYRIATKDDIPLLIELEKTHSGSSTYSPEIEAADWVEDLKNGTVYLIEMDGEVIGNAAYEPRGENDYYLGSIMVVPRFQGRGIGRMILQKLLEDMKCAKRIELVTHPNNAAALKLYENAGFVVESRHENYWGETEPRLLLALSR